MTNLSAISFVGQDGNGILAWWTQCIADRMARFGISVEMIDLLQEGWQAKLNARLAQGRPDFCFSFQGMGMGFAVDAGNLWSCLKVPFISSMGDAPYWSPPLHSASGKTLAHLYTSQEFLEFYVEFLKGKNFATFMPFGYPSNPHANNVAWHKRDLDLVFVKAGVDPNALRAAWAEVPAMLREMLEEASEIALAGQTESIGRIVANVFSERRFDLNENTNPFMYSCQKVDAYVRATRADRMARQIMRHGGHIFGDWPHLDRGKSRAVFHGKIPAGQLNKLYARSRILANTAPCTLTGMHERILAAFQAKAFILTDSSPFLEERLASYPSFKSVPIESAEFADILDARLLEIRRLGAEPAATQAMLDDVRVRAETEFGLDQFISRMLEVVSSLKAGRGNEIHAK